MTVDNLSREVLSPECGHTFHVECFINEMMGRKKVKQKQVEALTRQRNNEADINVGRVLISMKIHPKERYSMARLES